MKFLAVFIGCLAFALFSCPGIVVANDIPLPLPEILQPKKEPDYSTRQALLDKQYQDCPRDHPNIFSAENKDLLCSCLTVAADKAFDDAELRRYVMREKGWMALKDILLIHDYPSCVAKALHHLAYDECMLSFQKTPGFRQEKEICNCAGQGFEDFILERADDMITSYIYQNPKGHTPYNQFISGHGFKVQHQFLMRTCIQRHEYGWK